MLFNRLEFKLSGSLVWMRLTQTWYIWF